MISIGLVSVELSSTPQFNSSLKYFVSVTKYYIQLMSVVSPDLIRNITHDS
jgi:hypothetical protein